MGKAKKKLHAIADSGVLATYKNYFYLTDNVFVKFFEIFGCFPFIPCFMHHPLYG